MPGPRQPRRARGHGGEDGAPLHRRVDLSGAAGRAAAAFRVAQRLRHRRASARSRSRLFYDEGWVKEPADIFTLAERDNAQIEAEEREGYGEISVAQPVRRDRGAAQHRARPASSMRSASATSARPTRGAGRGTTAPRSVARRALKVVAKGDEETEAYEDLTLDRGHRRDRGRCLRRVLRGAAQPRGGRPAAERDRGDADGEPSSATRRSPARPWCSPARWRR